MGVVTGSIYAVVIVVKSFVVGLIVGAVVQMISGVSYTALMVAIGWTAVAVADAYSWRSTRLRERCSDITSNSNITLNIADRVQVLDLRR